MKTKFIFIIFFLLFISCKDKINESIISYPEVGFWVRDFEPAWSPDGKTIAYVHGDTIPGATGIYLIDTNGQNIRLLFASNKAYAPSWDPTGEWIVFSNYKNIYKIKKDGTKFTQLTFDGENHFPVWSPDGKYIAYKNNDCGTSLEPPLPDYCGITLTNFDGKSKKLIGKYSGYPCWLNNIELIWIKRAVKSDGSLLGDTIFIYELNNNTKKFLTFLNNKNFENMFFKYSKITSQFCFTSFPYASLSQIWKMNRDGKNLIQLTTTQGYSNDWSPDGELVVYTDSSPESGTLWIMDKNGNNKRKLIK